MSKLAHYNFIAFFGKKKKKYNRLSTSYARKVEKRSIISKFAYNQLVEFSVVRKNAQVLDQKTASRCVPPR